MRAQFDNPSMDIDRPLNEITNRLNKNLDALGALRKQRLKQDEKLTAISIGTIAQQFHKQLLDGVLQQERDEAEEEERRFLEKKKQRERESLTTIDAEYEVVDDGDREEE
jgi:DNA-binding FadR family transcriptional regulator